MMINVSRFVSTQAVIRDFINLYVKTTSDAVRANYMMPESISSASDHMQRLKMTFENEYRDCGSSWFEVKSALNSVFDHLRVYVINSKSDQVLEFAKYQKEGVGLTAIAIGGLSLSRGLTIEGLTVSYMYRNTKMYDTLMQMGRWFGYRAGYEDLCRVYLARESADWYSHIAEAAEELIQQAKQMSRNDLSPKLFGLFVRSHSKSLIITAANKMRTAEEVLISQNLTGQLIESTSLSFDKNINSANERLFEEFVKENYNSIQPVDKGWFIPNIKVDSIIEFLIAFKTHVNSFPKKSIAIDFLEAIKNHYPNGDVLLISSRTEDSDIYALAPQYRTAKGAASTEWRISGYRVASRGDEQYGLSRDQIELAERKAAEGIKSETGKPSDYHYRLARRQPLLMLHVLSPKDNDEFSGLRVPAFGVSFPDDDDLYRTEVKVAVNRVWLKQMQGPEDNPDDEEDYDV
jgi:hypothetical protein